MNNQTTQLALGQQPTLNNMGIDMGALVDEWKLSKSYVEQYTRDFPALDTLVDGVPVSRRGNDPYVGDTTLAGLVKSMPRNSLKQLPVLSVVVNGTKYSISALLITFLLKKFAFNEDTFGKGLLSTLQIGGEQAYTHGYAPFMVATGSMFNNFGTVLKLLHYMDTAPEPGIQDHNETGFDYVVANLAPSRVRKILNNARNNPNTTWNVQALERLLESGPRATNYSIYESAARQNQAGEQAGPTYQFVTRYETGPGGKIVTFSPDMQEAPLRVMDSRSKFGYPRVMYLVIDPAAMTPFGTSRVRLASPQQNLMNIYLGHIASMLLLNSKPPILKRGRFVKPVNLRQSAVWESLDPNASVDIKTIDNGALQSFPVFSQQIVGQIQNIMGRKGAGVMNANTGSFGYSKTAPGVQMQQQDQDTDENQMTNLFENFLRQYGLVAIDTLLSESEGEDDIIVDDDTKKQMNEIQAGYVGDDNKVHVIWEELYSFVEDWSVEIDVSLSPDQLKDKKRADLQDTLTVVGQNAGELGPGAAVAANQITNTLLQDADPLAKPIPQTPIPTAQPTPVEPAAPMQ